MKTIIGKFILIFILLNTVLFAANEVVNVSVDNPFPYKGDAVTYTITANGKNVKFPDILDIGGNKIINTSTARRISNINGQVSSSISHSYSFVINKSFSIPSYQVNVDGQNYSTDTIDIKVIKPSMAKFGDKYILELKSNKKDLNIGEKATLTIVFKHRMDAKMKRINVGNLNLDNFWAKKSDKVKEHIDKQYIVDEITYELTAKKAGQIELGPIWFEILEEAKRQVHRRSFQEDFFDLSPFIGGNYKKTKVFSNSVKFNIKPLPEGLDIFGHYTISLYVDKKASNANKPIKAQLVIESDGSGNIEDIEKYNLNIDNATVYSEEPKIVGNKFIQNFTIIGTDNFIIPALSLEYYDNIEKNKKVIFTKPINIMILNAIKHNNTSDKMKNKNVVNESKNQKDKMEQVNDNKLILGLYKEELIVVLIFIFSILLFIFSIWKKNQNFRKSLTETEKYKIEFIKSIKEAKNNKELFEILIKFSKDNKELLDIASKLERSIYKNEDFNIDKQSIIDIIENLNIDSI